MSYDKKYVYPKASYEAFSNPGMGFGCWAEVGKEGAEKIKASMDVFRSEGASLFDDISEIADYSKGIDDLPRENVLRFNFKDGSWAAVRPSGTEPKLKMYFSVKGENREQASGKHECSLCRAL